MMDIGDLDRSGEEMPIPDSWRPVFREIAAAFASGDFQLENRIVKGVAPIDNSDAKFFRKSVAGYGEKLTPLSDETWERSVHIFMGSFWDFLIDLSTEAANVSDLALHARVTMDDHRIQIWSVHVP